MVICVGVFQDEWTPLISAAMKNHVEIVEMLLNAGAKINETNYEVRCHFNFGFDHIWMILNCFEGIFSIDDGM